MCASQEFLHGRVAQGLYIILYSALLYKCFSVLNIFAREKSARSEETLEAEKAALDKRVRELTFRLYMRVEDIPALIGDPLKAASSVSCTGPFLEELQALLCY